MIFSSFSELLQGALGVYYAPFGNFMRLKGVLCVFSRMGPLRRSENQDKAIRWLEIYCSSTMKCVSMIVQSMIIGKVKWSNKFNVSKQISLAGNSSFDKLQYTFISTSAAIPKFSGSKRYYELLGSLCMDQDRLHLFLHVNEHAAKNDAK